MLKLTSDSFGWTQDAQGFNLAVRTNRAKEIAERLNDGKTYTIEIKEYKPKRSLDANAYAWVLIDKIAAKIGLTKTEVYRAAISQIGGNSDTVCVMEKAADALCNGWSHNGLGWVTQRFPSKIDGCVNVTLYYGSSTYDSKTMSRLIDSLIEDARSLDIETMTPNELARLEGYGA